MKDKNKMLSACVKKDRSLGGTGGYRPAFTGYRYMLHSCIWVHKGGLEHGGNQVTIDLHY